MRGAKILRARAQRRIGTQLALRGDVPSNPDLDALLAADEEARARVAAAEREAEAIVQAARAEHERRRVERSRAEQRQLDDEVRAIQEQAQAEADARRRRREAWRRDRRELLEQRLDEAAREWARIVIEGVPS
jgi:hypothetical protein